MAAAFAGRPQRAATLLNRALHLLPAVASPARERVRARILISLAYSEAELHSVPDGLRRLDAAAEVASGLPAEPADDGLHAALHNQRGLLLAMSGQLREALHEVDTAVPLFAAAGRHDELSRSLLNRGLLHLQLRGYDQADADLRRSVSVASAAGLAANAAAARHNLGYVALITGDLPAALREMAAARTVLAEVEPALEAVCALDQARVLFAAGLVHDADAELSHAIAKFRVQRSGRDRAEAELTRALVALLGGRADAARRSASVAARRFERRGHLLWAQLAISTALYAQVESGVGLRSAARRAVEAAGRLRAGGLLEDAHFASMVAAWALLRLGRATEAAQVAAPATVLRAGYRIGTRVLARRIRAELAAAAGDARRHDAELRAGLGDLRRYQSRFGSLDLQTASALHGHELAEMGLRAAVASGRPAAVLGWAERARALASNLPPVRPPEDARAAEMLAELRQVRTDLRTAELVGRPLRALRARRAELERQIRQRSWFVSGPGSAERPASLAQVRAGLGDGCLVAFITVNSQLHALVVHARAARLVALTGVAGVTSVLQRVRADLDAAALSVVPPALRAAVLRSLAAGLRRLDDALWRPLAALTGDGPVLIVPTSPLGAVPWTLLPGLRGRALSVAPSATWWLASRGRPVGAQAPVFAAGPLVARGEAEVRAAAAAWPVATVLTGDRATGQAVLTAAANGRLLHVAAHGVHEPGNPLFSSIQLADGPLFGYDLPRAAALPSHVVLSACDLGLAEVRPGDEAMGMTSALLHGGVASVVAGVGRVGDDVASTAMIVYHKALAGGELPASALAMAVAAVDGIPAPLVCFGAGW